MDDGEAGTVESAIAAAPRDKRPQALWSAWEHEEIALSALRRLLPDAWKEPIRPCDYLSEPKWIALFRAAGYVYDDDELKRPPEESLELYRGQRKDREGFGLAWSTSIERARYFAN